MNTSRKGTEIELSAIRHLEGLGYVVHRCIRNAVETPGGWVSQGNDIWGCVDILAKRRGEPVRYIQVTSRKGVSETRKRLEAVPWDDEHESVEIWRWASSLRNGSPAYFQIYYRSQRYENHVSNRVYPTGVVSADHRPAP